MDISEYQRTVLDLTRPLDKNTVIYTSGSYRDPDFRAERWCTIREQGFAVSRLQLGTQTGTHIDAPAHFVEGADTLDALSPAMCTGRYFLLDVPLTAAALHAYHGEPCLFLRAGSGSEITSMQLEQLLALPPRLWLVSGAITITGQPELYFHRRIAADGVFLVEDLLESAAQVVPARGVVVALPLRLIGVSGSPCRVIVLPDFRFMQR